MTLTSMPKAIRAPQQAASLLSDVTLTARELVPIGRSAVAELEGVWIEDKLTDTTGCARADGPVWCPSSPLW